LQTFDNSITTFLLVPLNLSDEEQARRTKMRKTITLMGKAAESFFYARCALDLSFYDEGTTVRYNSARQKNSKEFGPNSTKSLHHELYPVLITEYRLDGKIPNSGRQAGMIMMDVTGDMM
jgi:hypothetical protein